MAQGYSASTGISAPILQVFGEIYQQVSTAMRPGLSERFNRVSADFRVLIRNRVAVIEGERTPSESAWTQSGPSAAERLQARNHIQDVLFMADAVLRTEFPACKNSAAEQLELLAQKPYPELLEADQRETMAALFKGDLLRLGALIKDEDQWDEARELLISLRAALINK
jgi:hypothetical protein